MISSALPAILAGPILRRVERQRFWIWLATSVQCRVSVAATVYSPVVGKNGKFSPTSARVQTTQHSVQIGPHIIVSLLQVAITNGQFPVGGYVEYEVEAGPENRELSKAFKDRNRHVSLGNNSRPYFFVPFNHGEDPLEILYVSCRRLRRSRKDAVRAMMSDVLTRHKKGLSLPSVLILGGDQIYADDVDSRTLQQVERLAERLFGGNFAKINRREFVRRARLTTKDGENHLTKFEEIACLYLLSWSTSLPQTDTSRDISDEISDWESLLAHIPTYMIFDDHEVTDDWFLDTRWRETVISSAAGASYIDDALAAYFFFQGWGNNAGGFEASEIEDLGSWLGQRRQGNRPRAPLISSATWSFLIPSDWPIVCLDCRTRRIRPKDWQWFVYNEWGKTPYTSRSIDPVIVASSEMDVVRTMITSATVKRKDPAVLITNTPIFGLPAVGRFQSFWRDLCDVLDRSSAEMLRFDPESWDINPASWVELSHNLLDQLDTTRWVIVSGDVHFSYIGEGRLTTPSGKAFSCLQFVSSPTNNRTSSLQHLDRFAVAASYQAVWWPKSGLAVGTAPVQSEADYWRVVKPLSRNLGSDPYSKVWKGASSRPGGRHISNSNVYGKIILSSTEVIAELLSATGDREHSYIWR